MMQAHVFQLTGTFSLISTGALRAQAALAMAETPRLDWHFTLADIGKEQREDDRGNKTERKREQKRNKEVQGEYTMKDKRKLTGKRARNRDGDGRGIRG